MNKEITKLKALKRAEKYNLVYEVVNELKSGATPWEALKEWDLLDENEL